MILVTTDYISGYEVKTLGLASGTIVKTKNMFVDFFQSFKNSIGGELGWYTEMMEEAWTDATNRMVKQAEEMGADAIIAVRYATSNILDGASEIVVYGTAVKLNPIDTSRN